MLDHSGTRLEATTDAWIREVVGNAATLHERTTLDFVPTVGEEAKVAERLEAWAKRVADGDPQRFARRLAFDDLDAAAAERMVRDAQLRADAPVPSWAPLLVAVGRRMQTHSAAEPMAASNPIAFEELLADFGAEAELRLGGKVGAAYDRVAAPAHEQLRRVLLLTLGWLSGQSLALEFRVFRESQESGFARLVRRASATKSDRLYRAFVAHHRADGLRSLAAEYSSLVRMLCTVTQMWIDTTAELLTRLDSDWDVLRDELMGGEDPGSVRWVMTGLSDRHNHGRIVAIVHFESGAKVVYKPKDLGLEVAWFRLMTDLGAPFDARALHVIERPDYGWVEFAESNPAQSAEEVALYYRRVGGLLAVVHVLSATDCHYENVVACGAYPVLVDGETVLHHSRAVAEVPEGFGAQAAAVRLLECSVLRPGLLPQWSAAPEGKAEDRSGLGSESKGVSRREFAAYDDLRSDDLELRPRRIETSRGDNVPTLQGRRTSVLHHQQTFVDGFADTMRDFIARREPLAERLQKFAGLRSRFIFRPTQVYADLLEDANHPDLMRSGVERSLYFEALARVPERWAERPAWWPLLRSELAALARLDVPTFFAAVDDDVLYADDGRSAKGVLRGPSLGFVQDRLRELDEGHLATQVELIWGSLYSRDIDRHKLDTSARAEATAVPQRPPVMGSDDFLGEAVRLGDELLAQAVAGSDGSLAWVGFDHIPGTGRFRLQPISGSLYAGTTGIGLFFAALFAATAERRFADGARAAVRHGVADAHADGQEGVVAATHGAACGAASVAYALCQMAELTGEEHYLEGARAAARQLTIPLVEADRVHDLCAGTAGTIVGLLPLWRTTADAELRRVLMACGDHLLAARVEDPSSGTLGWLTIEGHPLTGMSHGSAGIAMALHRLGTALGVSRFTEAAVQALGFERAKYVPQCENWPDFRDQQGAHGDQCMTSWCHGAPGIGMARAAMAGDGGPVDRDLQIAAKTTSRLGVGACDNLCCGNFGRIDALLTMGRATGASEWIERARSQAMAATAQARALGGFDLLPGVPRGVHVPGFFQGVAGIGYTYLRLTDPERFPSVLSWEDARG